MKQDHGTLLTLWHERLKAHGYRVTESLRAVVQVLADSTKALTAIELFDLGRTTHPSLGLVTVYRTLDKLEELSLIQRVHRPDGCHSYLRAPQEHEHLLICSNCGEGFFFSGDDLADLIASVSQQTGFVIQDHWLQLFGVCPICQNENHGMKK